MSCLVGRFIGLLWIKIINKIIRIGNKNYFFLFCIDFFIIERGGIFYIFSNVMLCSVIIKDLILKVNI